MSYDLRMFKPRADQSANPAASVRPADFPTTPPSPEAEALKRKVANALIAHNSQLRIAPLPYEQIAHFEGISVEDTRRKYRHVELSAPEACNGILIILRDDEAAVTIPFWHEGQKAADTFRELWSYVEIICRESGYALHDPQIGRMLEPGAGCAEVLARYNETVGQIREALPGSGQQEVSEWFAMRSTPGAGGGETPGRFQIRQVSASEDSGVVLVAVREDGASCGFAEVSLRQNPVEKESPFGVASLDGWYVEPELRQRGIGRRLLESAERWAAARGITELAAKVKVDNEPTIRTHRSFGFAETGLEGQFIKHILPALLRASDRKMA
jgi:aminoglycoside 6'-N-acetyltransferase I